MRRKKASRGVQRTRRKVRPAFPGLRGGRGLRGEPVRWEPRDGPGVIGAPGDAGTPEAACLPY